MADGAHPAVSDASAPAGPRFFARMRHGRWGALVLAMGIVPEEENERGSEDPRARLPGFFLIGAMKAGTTSAYRYLAQHPELFLPDRKEPNYYWIGESPETADRLPDITRRTSTLDRRSYQSLYRGARRGQRCGEGSIRYLSSPRAARRIAEEIPHARALAILRHPAERAWSHYCANRERGVEPLADFAAALDQEESRLHPEFDQRFGYAWLGLYYEHLRAWDDALHPDRICIATYEDFCASPSRVLRRFFDFLEVEPSFRPDTSVRHNQSGQGRTRWLGRLLAHPQLRSRASSGVPARFSAGLGTLLRTRRRPLGEVERARLIETYREDTLRLQDRLGRDLSAWLR